jgi:hypothetical protein
MGTQYTGDIFMAKMPVEALVLRAHELLVGNGLLLDPPLEMWVDDQEQDEPIPEYVAANIEDAARYASTWPYTSSLGYSLRTAPEDPECKSTGYVLHVFYTPNLDLSVLGFSFIGSVFRPNEFPNSLPVITSLIEALHEGFGALRSVFGWGLSDDVGTEDEVLALSKGRAVPRAWQWLDILDASLATDDVFAWYKSALGPTSVLRRTANGSLFWQRDAGPP